MNENLRQKQVTFVLLGGALLTALTMAATVLLVYLGVDNNILLNAIVYAIEFGAYCLAMFIYRTSISRVVWFSQGFLLLIFLTLVKVVLSVIVYFFLVSLSGRMYGSAGIFLLALFGPFVRGFLFELPLMALAARIFETDIFQKNNHKDGRIIDDQLK